MSEMMRIARALAHAGVDSRRKCEAFIEKGQVEVNGEVITDLSMRVDIHGDNILFRGRPLFFQEHVYYMVHKPVGYTTTVSDPYAKKTVFDLLPKKLVSKNVGKALNRQRVFPVGRLDRDSSGLLLFTSDGDLANQLLHPRYETPKVYEVRLGKAFERKDREKLLEGVKLKDGFSKAIKVYQRTRRILEVTMKEGKKREVRRLFDAIGYKVVDLCRLQFANLILGRLKPGEGRFLISKEITRLKELPQKPRKKK